MIRSTIWVLAALTFLGFGALRNRGSDVVSASESGADQKPAAAPPALADQIKEMQKQLAELRSQTPRIVAAGTATLRRPELMDNTTHVHVRLSEEFASKLGEDYIVLLTNRYPVGGYPYFSVYWKRAKHGFDVYLVDISLNWGTTASYTNKNTAYLIDWMVVKK